MELPSKRDQKRDFRAWKRELRESETFAGEEYVAPSRLQRFGRAFRYWFVSYENRQGPKDEYYETSDPRHYKTFNDLIDPDEGEWRYLL